MSVHTDRLAGRLARTADRLLAFARDRDLMFTDTDLLAQVKLPWYEIRAADGAGTGGGNVDRGTTDVFIFDEIGGSFGVSAKQFVTDLEAIDTPRINLRINSPGGAVFEAVTIHSALLHHPAIVRSYVDGVAASAASVIAMGADPYDPDADTGGVFVMPGAQLMIHDASNMLDGNAEEHRQDALFLDRQSDNIAGMYAGRAGGDAAGWRELMLAETWLFADEAVAAGLADAVYQRTGPADERLTRAHDLTRWQYRYAGRRAAPAPATRRHATTGRPGRARHSEGSTPAMTTTVRQSPEALRADAARRRTAGAEQAGYRLRAGARGQTRGVFTPPAGPARSLEFPARLTAKLETRRGQELYHLHGMASMYGRRYRYEMWDEFGPYWELVNERAADVTLAADPDVAFLVNHRGVTMARTRNDTLELQSNTGLETDAWLNPKRQDVSDLVIAIEDRNVTEMSFAFMLDDGLWNDDFTEFEITRFDLNRGDVSAVNYGANPHTSIAARQRELLGELDRMSPALGRAAMGRLLQRQDLDLDMLYEVAAADHDEAVARKAPPAVASVSVPAGRSIAHIEAMLLDE